jgi:uridine kinase
VTEWWAELERLVLVPLAAGSAVRYPAYDWRPRRVREWREFGPPRVLILEGVSSARPEVRSRLSCAVVVTAPREVRLARGLERDGEAARADWERWLAEEDEHFRAARTEAFAEVTVDGAPVLDHDPEREFVLLERRPAGH